MQCSIDGTTGLKLDEGVPVTSTEGEAVVVLNVADVGPTCAREAAVVLEA